MNLGIRAYGKREGFVVNAVDGADAFIGSFEDEIVLDSATHTNIFKNSISAVPINTTSIKDLHNRR